MTLCRCVKCKWLVERMDFNTFFRDGWYWYCDVKMIKLHRVLLPRFCKHYEKYEEAVE